MVTAAELRLIYENVGDLHGWDFSPARIHEQQPAWQFEEVVQRYLGSDALVCDIGTGGGEAFSVFTDNCALALGIDRNGDRMQETCPRRKRSLQFAVMDGAALALRDRSLDLVLARHADYVPAEVHRVLRPGGVFVTQQMGDNDTANLFEAFQWGSYGAYWRARFASMGLPYRAVADTAREFQALGCEVLELAEYDIRQHFQDVESLVFFLKASPLPEQFEPERHWQPLARLVDDYTTPAGIATNAHRELLIVRKLLS